VGRGLNSKVQLTTARNVEGFVFFILKGKAALNSDKHPVFSFFSCCFSNDIYIFRLADLTLTYTNQTNNPLFTVRPEISGGARKLRCYNAWKWHGLQFLRMLG